MLDAYHSPLLLLIFTNVQKRVKIDNKVIVVTAAVGNAMCPAVSLSSVK